MSRPVGEFERAVLLAIIRLRDDAYGVTIREEIGNRLHRQVSFGAVYATLDRLERKGMVSSQLGEPTAQRGGRAKRFFRVEPLGVRALEHARKTSEAVWAISPMPRRR